MVSRSLEKLFCSVALLGGVVNADAAGCSYDFHQELGIVEYINLASDTGWITCKVKGKGGIFPVRRTFNCPDGKTSALLVQYAFKMKVFQIRDGKKEHCQYVKQRAWSLGWWKVR
jgi:hypothetical protein